MQQQQWQQQQQQKPQQRVLPHLPMQESRGEEKGQTETVMMEDRFEEGVGKKGIFFSA